MPEGLNQFETAILKWFSASLGESQTVDQIELAKFIKRNWTKVGFYVDFEISVDPYHRLIDRERLDNVVGSEPVDERAYSPDVAFWRRPPSPSDVAVLDDFLRLDPGPEQWDDPAFAPVLRI